MAYIDIDIEDYLDEVDLYCLVEEVVGRMKRAKKRSEKQNERDKQALERFKKEVIEGLFDVDSEKESGRDKQALERFKKEVIEGLFDVDSDNVFDLIKTALNLSVSSELKLKELLKENNFID